MEKFSRAFFSMGMMTLALFVFLAAIGIATFLESIYDLQTAKILVYNAKWFEVLIIYLCLNLIANIFKHRMFRKEKVAVLMFHLAFIIMIIGAGVTRYFSFEGLMIIKEGQQTNFIYSADPHIWLRVNDGKKQYTVSRQLWMSEATNNDFELDVDFPGHAAPVTVKYVDFQSNMIDSLVINDSIQGSALEFIVMGQPFYVAEGRVENLAGVPLSYVVKNGAGISVWKDGLKLKMRSELPFSYLDMAQLTPEDRQNPSRLDSMTVQIPVDSVIALEAGRLYSVGQAQFVFKGVKQHAAMKRLKSPKRDTGTDYLIVDVTNGKDTKRIELPGGKDAIPDHVVDQVGDLTFELEYGSIRIDLPFFVKCRDFQLDRYPGSMSPSSFASEVTIIDEKNDYTRDQRIFMNNVMDYGGYRFFQSSYEPDESGTRLSVNHDWWGTNISYLGYLMMGIGMLLSLFMRGGRFRELLGLLRKSRLKRESLNALVIALLLSGGTVFGQTHEHDHNHASDPVDTEEKKVLSKRPAFVPTFKVMTEEHSEEVASLLVQNFSGRIVPMHTLCDELLRKIHRGNTYKDYNAIQTIVSMHMHPDYWMSEDIIYVSTKGGLRDKVKHQDGYTSYKKLIDQEGNFILLADYQVAFQKLESRRNEYDKQLIKLGEKFEVVQSIFSWRYMHIIPLKSDPDKNWYSPLNIQLLETDTSGIKKGIRYLSALDSASSDLKPWSEAVEALNVLKEFQYSEAGDIVPSKSAVNMEISYNKMNVFKNSGNLYLMFGMLALITFFIGLFIRPTERTKKVFKRITQALWVLMTVTFLYHGYGLYMRAIISGHAPWSNSYEVVIFVAWVVVLLGLIFSRKMAVVLGAAGIFAYLLLFVSDLSLMDPEITPLVPVLKSYWLKIHVAVITGSYAPLGFAAILGFLNLILYIVRSPKRGKVMTMSINELTYINEMMMTIGVFMLTIGTFLGGVWANESWGRYWGWDPKETWALVAILVYAVILHLRYIPGLKSKFLFNAVSLWGYSSIIFTFFGVNYYLVGLHSYANGEGVGAMPVALKAVMIGFAVLTALAAFRNYQYKKAKKEEDHES